jgi:hypothetical protein
MEFNQARQVLDGISTAAERAGKRAARLDNFDFDEICRDMARNDGLPARWLMEEELVAQQRAARAQAQQQAMQAEQMERTAAALGKAGAVKQDSMLAGMLPGMSAA